MRYSTAAALVALLTMSTPVLSHSWIEMLRIIDSSGRYTSAPGYPRAYVDRKNPSFSDTQLVHILPPSDPKEAKRDLEKRAFSSTQGISPTDAMCRRSQQGMTQTPGFARLSAAPGDRLALLWQENGHVTLPQNSVRKPDNRGDVYIYATSQPKDKENFLDVFKKWDATGKGGDGRGRLLAKQDYDDGRCYQVNPGQISTQRQKQFPHKPTELFGGDIWCQSNFKLPADLPVGKPYTIYWVWDWPTLAGGQGQPVPEGKAEIYTTCMDIDIKAPTQPKIRRDQGDLTEQAIPKYMAEMNQAQPAAQAFASDSKPASSASTPKPAPQAPAAQAAQAPAPQAVSGAPPAQAPAPKSVQEAPAAQAPAATKPTPNAQSIVLEALGPSLVDQIASKLMAAKTVTSTVGAATIQAQANPGPAKPQSQAADAPANQNPGTKTVTKSSATIIGTVTAFPSAMPTTLQFAAPVMAPGSATMAQPAAASPVASGSSGAVTAGRPHKRCETCHMRRSRIFGKHA